MSSRRVLKVAEAIREEVAMAILTGIKDPRVRDVTVTFVEVTPDLRQAKVHVSVMGDEKRQNLALHGLKSAAGFLQSKLSDRIDTRYTPRLEFLLDQGVKRSLEITQILDRLAQERAEREGVAPVDDAGVQNTEVDSAEDDFDTDDLEEDELEGGDLEEDAGDRDEPGPKDGGD